MSKILQVATDEFNAIRARADSKVAERKELEVESQERLANSIKSCKRDFKRKQFYAENGAKFTRHFISSFGKIVHIEFISECLALVFCDQGTIEVWSLDLKDPESQPELFDFIAINRGNVSCVESFNIGEKAEEIVHPGSTASKSTPLAIAEEDEEEEEQFGQSDSDDESPIRPAEQQRVETPKDNTKRQFFIGLEDGRACSISIQFLENPGNQVPRILSKVQETIRISSSPVKTAVLDKVQGLVFVSTSNAIDEHQLIAVDDQLQIVWKHKVSDIAVGCEDNGIQELTFMTPDSENMSSITSRVTSGNSRSSGKSSKLSSDEDECCISLLKYDNHNNRILAALSWGSILSLGYKENGRASSENTSKEGTSPAPAYIASHLFDVLGLEEEAMGDGISSLPASSRPSMSSFGKQSSSNLGREARPPTVKVT